VANVTAEVRLERADFPVSIAGCQLLELPGNKEGGRPLGAVYDIRSGGLLGAQHGTLFRAEGDVAEIVSIAKSGLFVAYQYQSVPIDEHVEVLRDLGFNEMILPDGRRYETSMPA
jgi:hypothetical protein